MRARHIVAGLALIFFAFPIGLRVFGEKASSFENHAFAPAPKLGDRFKVFPEMTAFFKDRMPGREDAVHANRWITEEVFGTIDESQVVQGRDGWLFLTGSIAGGCPIYWATTPAAAAARWKRLETTIRRAGKKPVFLVAPDKESVYAENLPDKYPFKHCEVTGKPRFERELAAQRSRDFIPLRDDLLAAKAHNRQPLYYFQDGHWNLLGATYLTKAVLDSLGGKIRLKPSDRQIGTQAYNGDLSNLRAKPTVRDEPFVKIVRPGAPRIAGRTLLIGDSFGFVSQSVVEPYFKHFQIIHIDTPPAQVAQAIANSDQVIIECVGRSYLERSLTVATPLERLIRKQAR